MGDCKLLKRFMDRDLYYKYSELRLIKHPTSLSYNQNIVNNHGELDWLIVKWPNDTGQKYSSLCKGGAGESSAGSKSRSAASLVDGSIFSEQLAHPVFSWAEITRSHCWSW